MDSMAPKRAPHPESLQAIAERLDDLQFALGYTKRSEFVREINRGLAPEDQISEQSWYSYLHGTLIPVHAANVLYRKYSLDLMWTYHGVDKDIPHSLALKLLAARKLRGR